MRGTSTEARLLGVVAAACAALALEACVYRIDVQQGNLLEEERVAQVEVGMTKSQVQFLLGTPTIEDVFHADRWDYPYYMRRGRSREVEQRWVVVYFENDRVTRIERVGVAPSASANSRS